MSSIHTSVRAQAPIEEGAGLAVAKGKLGMEAHFITGVVSKVLIKETVCNQGLSKITNTTLYLDFIKNVEIGYRPAASISGKFILIIYLEREIV